MCMHSLYSLLQLNATLLVALSFLKHVQLTVPDGKKLANFLQAFWPLRVPALPPGLSIEMKSKELQVSIPL